MSIETFNGAPDTPRRKAWRIIVSECALGSLGIADRILDRLTAAGLAIVPVEPTEEMVEAALAAWRERMRQKTQGGQLRIAAHPSEPLVANYRAMLRAAHPSTQEPSQC